MSTPESDSVVLPSGENPDTSYSAYSDGFSRFQIYVKNAISKISSGISEEQFAHHLSQLTVIRKSKSAAGKMQKKLKTSLTESLVSEIDEMVKDENIEENLKQLERLVDESILDEGKKLWRPNGNVNDHIRSHLMRVKLKHKEELEQTVGEKEEEVESLVSKLSTLRTQVRSLEKRLLVLKSQSEDSSVIDSVDKKVAEVVGELE